MKLTKLALAIAAMVALSASTQALPILLGSVKPGSPASVAAEVIYVNNLLDVVQGILPDPTTIDGRAYNAVDANITVPGTYADVNAVDTIGNPDWDEAYTVTGGWDYALGKYGNTILVWFIGGETFTIPKNVPGFKNSISHYQLFNSHGNNVPDGGTTVALLGLGSLALALARRKA